MNEAESPTLLQKLSPRSIMTALSDAISLPEKPRLQETFLAKENVNNVTPFLKVDLEVLDPELEVDEDEDDSVGVGIMEEEVEVLEQDMIIPSDEKEECIEKWTTDFHEVHFKIIREESSEGDILMKVVDKDGVENELSPAMLNFLKCELGQMN